MYIQYVFVHEFLYSFKTKSRSDLERDLLYLNSSPEKNPVISASLSVGRRQPACHIASIRLNKTLRINMEFINGTC